MKTVSGRSIKCNKLPFCEACRERPVPADGALCRVCRTQGGARALGTLLLVAAWVCMGGLLVMGASCALGTWSGLR